ncbi:MAG: rane protein of unknown function, partial [Candidatus Saccharibacteria bacterium]|nr:rane protein of unknown function [Candidatus Saccharibacteria bacterium]
SRDKHNVKKQFRRYTGLAFAMLLAISLLTSVFTKSANADPVNPTTTTTTPATNQTANSQTPSKTQTTCSIEKVGWILCPVIQTAGKVGDSAFELLAGHFLETEPELVSTDSGTRTAWELARNLANLMFIAVFMIVILSQVTGRGIDNYGIKKLLPRLIVGAIAVNVSYYICQLMVDISNVMGFELEHFLVQTAQSITLTAVFPPETSIDVNTSSGSLGTMALVILGIGAAVWLLLPMLMLGVTTVVVACIVIVVILLMRKAFIVLLVVASPVAFVMYLLPNTEKFFQKWLKMFWQLLMVFPIVGLLFGGGQLASTIVLVAGSNACTKTNCEGSPYAGGDKCIQLPKGVKVSTTGTDASVAPPPAETAKAGACGKGSTPLMLGLVAAGIAVAPLFAVWAVLKGALSAAGTIGGKISGAIEKGTKGGADKAASMAKKRYDASAFGVGRELRKSGKEAFKRKRVLKDLGGGGGATGAYRRLAAGGLAGLTPDKLSTSTITAQKVAIERAASARDQIESEEVKNELSKIEYDKDGKLAGADKAFDDAIANKDMTKAKAAFSALMTTGEGGINKMADKLDRVMKEGGEDMAKGMREYIMQAHGGEVKGKNSAVEMWAKSYGAVDANGNADTTTRNRTVSEWGKQAETFNRLTDTQLAGQTDVVLGGDGAQAALNLVMPDGQARKVGMLSNAQVSQALSAQKKNLVDHGRTT